ncbi:MAG: putative DNA-binding domain-containing protein [Opitutaceae bacterium]|nr:putative DNA-binding domain-containing protein [Opitutaceae bacterium]
MHGHHLTNRLQAVLKRHYPQALQLMHEDIWRAMNLAFLRRWPSAPSSRNLSFRLATLKSFFHKHGSRSADRWEQRAVLSSLVALRLRNPSPICWKAPSWSICWRRSMPPSLATIPP